MIKLMLLVANYHKNTPLKIFNDVQVKWWYEAMKITATTIKFFALLCLLKGKLLKFDAIDIA